MFKSSIGSQLKGSGFTYLGNPCEIIDQILELIRTSAKDGYFNEFYLSTSEIIGGEYRNDKGYLVFGRKLR